MITKHLLMSAHAALVLGGAGLASPAFAEAGPEAAVPDIEIAPPDEVALSPEAEAFRAALSAEIADLDGTPRDAILEFYAGHDFAPFWTAAETDRYAVLLAAVERSPAHALPAARYGAGDLAALMGTDDVAKREAAATRTYLRFASDLRTGILTPSRIDPEINIRPERPQPAALLARLDAAPVDQVLAGLEPAGPEYRLLMAELERLEPLVGSDAWGAPVPDGPTLHPGESNPRVADLRERLTRLGYPAPAEDALAETAFDEGLEAAVRRFQRDNGLVDDGVPGRRTLRAINASPEQRLRQVAVNLERMRWMNQGGDERFIAVNIPDYTVTMYEQGAPIYHTRAVVGVERETETPEFSDTMTYMVVNPTWHIPDSIATRVYLPKLRSDPSVLARSNMRLFTRSGVEINPRLVDFSHYSASSFPFRIKQNPSAANALGRVKFMFPNQFSIYLHDTPARELFAKDGRAFSNGCVRLEDPLELAYLLLEDQVADPEAAFSGWLAAKSERYVNLDEPVPVHILYRTAFVEDGAIRYRHDVYGRDAKVFRALEAAGVTVPAVQG